MSIAAPVHHHSTAEQPPAQRLPLRALLAANTVSYVGTFMTLIALPWFVLSTTATVTGESW